MRFLRRQIADALDIVYPPVCGICGNEADSDDRLVCGRCWERIRGPEAPYCSQCRQSLIDTLRCPTCRPAPMVVFTLGYFDGPLRTILHDLKFAGLRPLAKILGQRLAASAAAGLGRIDIDIVVPVPLHDSRRLRRGFNQSEDIACAMAEPLGLPVARELLYSTRKTRQQARLPAHLRELNVRDAYAVDDPTGELNGKTVLLVDDVTTTGATLRENERVLLAASARRVVAAVAATAL